jgi:hypothetical protein
MSPLRLRLGVAGVVILAALVLSPAGASSAAVTTPRLGSHAMIDTSMSPETVDALFAATKRAHLGSIRLDIPAALQFPNAPAPADWKTLDVYRAAARKHRIEVLGVMYGTPWWLANCPPGANEFYRCPPIDYVAWEKLVRQIAAHAPEVGYWEILNEANLPDTYFYGDAVEYARFLRVTSAGLRAGNPKAKIVFSGVLAPYRDWLDKVLSQPGTMAAFDIANAHFRGGVGKLDEMVKQARGQFAYYGFEGPLWVTEMGYTSDPVWQYIPGFLGGDAATGLKSQARYLRRAMPVLLRSGASRVFLTLRDLDTQWGIFTSEGLLQWPVPLPKPAYRVVRRFAKRVATGAWPPARRGSARARAHPRRAPARRCGSSPRAGCASR